MTIDTAFIVCADSMDRTSSVLAVFDYRADADAFRALCTAYHKTQPTCRHDDTWDAWAAKHPGGFAAAYCYDFSIESPPLNPETLEGKRLWAATST